MIENEYKIDEEQPDEESKLIVLTGSFKSPSFHIEISLSENLENPVDTSMPVSPRYTT